MLNQKTLNKRLSRTFKERISIKKREFDIVKGFKKERLEDYYSCLSNPVELYATELYQAINIKLKSTGVFEVRYCQLIENMCFNEKDYVLEYKGQIFDVYHVDYLKNDKHVVLLKTNRVD